MREGISLLQETGYMIFLSPIRVVLVYGETLQRIQERLQKDMLKGYLKRRLMILLTARINPKRVVDAVNPCLEY
ncbi:hypothetical protein DVH26_19970 [Paenibacillus sp. H1-7]|nr:hypothetical protein DVH26_19970 [Paenibacillus sp. H1-7]